LTTHIITFGCQLDKQQKKCKHINVIILDEAKTVHFVGQMYKSDYYTKEQMTKYKMQTDVNMTWLHTLEFFTQLFAQCKAYGDNFAANSGFDSAVHINEVPTDCNLVSTSSDFTTCDLYIKSLKESLAAAWEYVIKWRASTPDKPDPAALLHMDLKAQHKQFDHIMKQNSALLAAMSKETVAEVAKGSGSSGGSGCRGSEGGSGNRCRDQGTKAMCPNCNKLILHTVANCFMLPGNKDKILTWYKPPKLD
jgi:hypothetical protein